MEFGFGLLTELREGNQGTGEGQLGGIRFTREVATRRVCRAVSRWLPGPQRWSPTEPTRRDTVLHADATG